MSELGLREHASEDPGRQTRDAREADHRRRLNAPLLPFAVASLQRYSDSNFCEKRIWVFININVNSMGDIRIGRRQDGR
jgi:hypothetical protein